MERKLKTKGMKQERTYRDKEITYKRNLMKKSKNCKTIQ